MFLMIKFYKSKKKLLERRSEIGDFNLGKGLGIKKSVFTSYIYIKYIQDLKFHFLTKLLQIFTNNPLVSSKTFSKMQNFGF